MTVPKRQQICKWNSGSRPSSLRGKLVTIFDIQGRVEFLFLKFLQCKLGKCSPHFSAIGEKCKVFKFVESHSPQFFKRIEEIYDVKI